MKTRTTTAFTQDEKMLLVRLLERPLNRGNPAWDDDREEGCEPFSPDAGFAQAFELLATEFDRLGTTDGRSRFLAEAKWSRPVDTMRRGNWEEGQRFLKLYARLLHAFGWVDERFAPAIDRACATAGGDDAKLAVLFSSIMSLPFGITWTPCRDHARARATLDAALFGLQRVKNEIANHLVLVAHAQGVPSPRPLLLVGPPGTGKTAVGEAVANALELPLFKASLACAVDTMFFRGSHYGWAASAPGYFSKTLMTAKCENPVILLDEIDKAGGHGHGDVVDTLAEVFDPTQSHHFNDLFLVEVPIDLSRVTWIATANDLARVPAYIADRCRIIRVRQYREDERRVIIQKYLPAQIKKELRLGFPITVGEAVMRELAKGTESLREAKGALMELIARELTDKKPGTVRRLSLKTWDASVVCPLESSVRRPIGFLAEPGGEKVQD